MELQVGLSFAALTALAGALLGAGLTYLNGVSQKSNDAAKTLWTTLVDRRSRQLGELYAPLKMLRAQSKGLRALLPSIEPDDPETRWRLVHHAGSIGSAWRGMHADPPTEPPEELNLSKAEIEVAHLLMQTGDEACALIDSKAGLIDGGDPGGFREYKDHHRRLRLSWDTGDDQAAGASDPFQGDLVGLDDPDGVQDGKQTRETSIDIALDEDMEAVRSDHELLLGSGPTTKGTAVGVVLVIAGLALFAATAVPEIISNTDDTDLILVTTPDGALCGEISVDADGAASVGGTLIPAGAAVEFVERCE